MFLAASSLARRAHPVIQRFFEVSLYLLLFTGFAILAGTGMLDLFSLLLGLFILLVKGVLLLRGIDAQIPEQWTTYITFLYTAFFALDYFLISRVFIAALVHMVLLLALLKMFAIHRERDYVYLELLAFGMVLAAAVLTVNSLFFAIFCLFVLIAVMTFVSMEMRRAWIDAHPHALVEARYLRDLRRLPGSVSRTCVLLVLSIVLGTAVLFFVIPRKPSAGYLGTLAPHSELSTGFSEEVRLGEIGQIQQSSAVVMHVKFAPGTRVPPDMHWRGVALTLFDGRHWTGSLGEGPVEATTNGIFSASGFSSRLFLGHGPRVNYRVSLEPIGARVFFVLPEALFIAGRYQMIRIDSTGTIFNMDGSRSITDYGASSELAPPMPANLPQVDDVERNRNFTQLPPQLDPGVEKLALQVSALKPTPFLKAQAIERYLSSHYGYTLQLPDISPRDPIAYFLFDRKRGHCEYFASSMVVMLRTLGIPSRIVNGFRGGEYNDVTDSYIIRAKDAHSWVEAYFPGYGWYTFDPTPASTEVPTRWTRLYLYADAMQEFWHDWIVNYDTGHQTSLRFAIVRQSHSQFEKGHTWLDSVYRDCLLRVNSVRYRFQRHQAAWTIAMSIGVAIVIILLIGPKLFLAIRRICIARRPRIEPHSAATIWYGRVLKLLSKRGIRKAPTQTPQEFISTVSSFPVRRRLENFTDHYERARFGHSGADAEKLPELYRELELTPKE